MSEQRKTLSSADKASLYTEAFMLLTRVNAILNRTAKRGQTRLREVVTMIDERFVSGNTIPVERASIRAEEWAILRQYLLTSLENTEIDGAAEPPVPRAYYLCGICEHYHPINWDGDCRDDANRFTIDELNTRYGGNDCWIELPMPDSDMSSSEDSAQRFLPPES